MVHLTPATPADIPTIRDLAHRIWRAHYPAIIGPEQVEYMLDLMYSAGALEQQMVEKGCQFWLIRINGTPLGFMAVSRETERDYFLHKFYIETGRQGKGAGTAAFRCLLEQYPDLQTLRLTVNRQNYKSINFYFKIGFIIEKCVDMPIGQGFVMDDFLMRYQRAAG